MFEANDKVFISDKNIGNGLNLDLESAEKKLTVKVPTTEKVIDVDSDGLKTNLALTYDNDEKSLTLTGKDGTVVDSADLSSLASVEDLNDVDEKVNAAELKKRDKTDREVYIKKNEQWLWEDNDALPEDFLELANSLIAPKPQYHETSHSWSGIVFYNTDGSERYTSSPIHDSSFTGKETSLTFNFAQGFSCVVKRDPDLVDDETLIPVDESIAYKGDISRLSKEVEFFVGVAEESINYLRNNKVDKDGDKVLSTNDYTNEEKTKLAGLENYDDSEVRDLIDSKVDKDGDKVLSTNDYTTEEKNKLAGVATGAQVNVIEEIKLNGTKVEPTGKSVNLVVSVDAYTKNETNNLLSQKENTGVAASLINNLNKTDSAISGQVVSAVSESKGVITVTRRALVAGDIPALAISKITDLQTTLNSKVGTFSATDTADLSTDDGVVNAIKKILLKMGMKESNITMP